MRTPLRNPLRHLWHAALLLRRHYNRTPVPAKFAVWATLVAGAAAAFAGGLLIRGAHSCGDGWALWRTIVAEVAGRDGIYLIGHIYSIDIPSRSIQLSWLPVGCGSFMENGTEGYFFSTTGCGRLGIPVNFFVDGSMQPNATYEPGLALPDTDGFIQYVQSQNEFQTTHLMDISSWRGLDQQYAYPFDTYFLETGLLALHRDTNASVPILDLLPVDSVNNFSPHILARYSVRVPSPARDGTHATARYLRLDARRILLMKFFVMTLFLVNWALTGAVLYITVAADHGRPMDAGILVLPLSVVVTMPALRALWQGAPGFGILLDSCGLFVQMVTVALCSIFLVVGIGLRDAGPKPCYICQTSPASATEPGWHFPTTKLSV